MKGFIGLSAAVLIAIGLGVGIDASFGPPVYGVPGHTFSASFAGKPRKFVVSEGQNTLVEYQTHANGGAESVSLWLRRGPAPTLRQEVDAENQICRMAEGHECHWIAYAPLSGDSTAPGCEATNLRGVAIVVNGIHGRLTYDTTTDCGFAVGQLETTSNSASWLVSASSATGTASVEAFLTSFLLREP